MTGTSTEPAPRTPSKELAPRPDEVRELARLALVELGRAAGGIGGFHSAIAGRVFRYVGPQSRPTQLVHDGISEKVYRGLEGGARLAARGATAALSLRTVPDGRPVSRHPLGASAVAILEGLVGDELEREGSDLAEPLSIRAHAEVVPPRAPDLAAAYPDATGRIVVFLHGLMETELSWRRGVEPRTYGERLRDEHGWTPVDVRYNTGRRVSRNGRSLADQLALLVEAWPVEVERIALVGHSMGGLVARSACHRAAREGAEWVQHVKHIVSLGTPHFGAPLEQAVHRASHALSRLPETEPIARFLRRRSGGIRDLNLGSLVDEDWLGRDPDELRLAACEEVPLLDGATHCFVSATITRNPNHPVARVVGDWLVLSESASGRGRTRSLGFREEDGLAVPSASHFALLNHPAVYAKLRQWLTVPDSTR